MKLIAHDQLNDATSHRYSVQTESGEVWLLFDLPPNSPFYPMDVAYAMEERLSKLPQAALASTKDGTK